jgi:antitoxin (DNA-binding transcriptional repressor) of toxin-antitoxin stability system
MKTMTIRDLRQHWPEAEAALKREGEILITRDSKPVAKLVNMVTADARRTRWNVKTHARWQQRISGGKTSRSDEALAKSRADRVFSGKLK